MRSGPGQLERSRVVLVQALRPVLERLGVVGVEALDGLRHEARALDREQMRETCSGAASGKTKRSENGPASGSVCRRRAMPWLSSQPPGRRSDASRAAYASMFALPTCSTMPIEAILSKGSPARSRQSMTWTSTRSPTPASSARCRAPDGLRLRERQPVARTPYSRAACTMKLPQPQPTSSSRSPPSAQLAADEVELRRAAPPRASAPRARRSRTSTSSTRRGRARRTRCRRRSGGGPRAGRARRLWRRPSGRSSAAGGFGGSVRPVGAGGGGGERRLRARGRAAAAVQCRAGRAPVDVVDLDLARDVRAAEAELPGARSAWASARSERTVNVGPPAVRRGQRRPVPS